MRSRGLPDSALRRIARKIGAHNEIILYHISNYLFDEFDIERTATKAIWFAKDKDSLVEEGHGADQRPGEPLYLYTCQVAISNSAGWEEYDKYYTSQLIEMGYDSIDLDEDIIIFHPENIKILSIEEVNNGSK